MVMKNLPEMLPEEDIKVRLFIERFVFWFTFSLPLLVSFLLESIFLGLW